MTGGSEGSAASLAASSPGARPPVGSSERPPNVVLIVLDCARAKNVLPWGEEPTARAPVIARLAREGTVFPATVAPSNWTIPSHMSFFTGSYPSHHGLRTFKPGAAPEETIASWLARRSYATGLFSEMVHLTGGYGLEEGFTERFGRRMGITDEQRTVTNRLAGHAGFLYSPSVRRLIERVPPFIVPMNAMNHPQEVAYKHDVCNDEMGGRFDRWLGTLSRERPFFAFVNFVDAHEPYPHVEDGAPVGLLGRWYARTPRYYLLSVQGLQAQVPWPYLVRGYVRTIEEADRKIGHLMEALARHGEEDRTMVIVTADHGQSFGEAGNVYHGCGATESITRVPLIVRPPLELSTPRRVDRWVSLCEIPSWIKAAASGRAPFDEEGHAPFPFRTSAPDATIVYCEGAPASDPNRSLRGIGTDQLWNHRLIAAYRGPEKYVLDLATGTIYGWDSRGDADRRTPATYVGREATELRVELFGPYEAEETDRRNRMPPTVETDEGAVDVSGRLRSWGYG